MAFSEMEIIKTILLVLLAAIAAIVYSLRVVVAMDRKLLRIESHIESLVSYVSSRASRSKKKRKR